MWGGGNKKHHCFEIEEMLTLKKALAAYKRELHSAETSDVSLEISRVNNLQLRFIGIKNV